MLVAERAARSILSKTGIPGARYALNPYTGCSHACRYCYAEFMREVLRPRGAVGGLRRRQGERGRAPRARAAADGARAGDARLGDRRLAAPRGALRARAPLPRPADRARLPGPGAHQVPARPARPRPAPRGEGRRGRPLRDHRRRADAGALRAGGAPDRGAGRRPAPAQGGGRQDVRLRRADAPDARPRAARRRAAPLRGRGADRRDELRGEDARALPAARAGALARPGVHRRGEGAIRAALDGTPVTLC